MIPAVPSHKVLDLVADIPVVLDILDNVLLPVCRDVAVVVDIRVQLEPGYVELVMHDPVEISELHSVISEHLCDAEWPRVWHLKALEIGLLDQHAVARLQVEIDVSREILLLPTDGRRRRRLLLSRLPSAVEQLEVLRHVLGVGH